MVYGGKAPEALEELQHQIENWLAFLQNDAAGMKQQQVDWASGKPGKEDRFLASEADTAAYFGRIGKAREFPVGQWLRPRGRNNNSPETA